MKLPIVTDEDIDEMFRLSPDLDFTDNERRAVLKEIGSRDIDAAPGSGKTTVLATKLLLLARKWTETRRGICVLSHTNVARAEIERRLGASLAGNELLGYPHFIGTIHSLVNQFLALPYLKSTGKHINIINDEVFAKKALHKAQADPKLRFWMQKDRGVASMVEGLIYEGATLNVTSEKRALPGERAPTRQRLLDIKESLTAEGIFRYADMFAYAEYALTKAPILKRLLSNRFPIVFIDEMQDTSWDQERLLNLMFDDRVIVQRFGDVNQRILNGEANHEKLTFPKANALPISTSKRFGPRIAQTVARVQLSGVAVNGQGNDPHPPMLLTYATGKIGAVIEKFGRTVLTLHSEEQLRKGAVKAMCARKHSDAGKALPGRALPDYWPGFIEDLKPVGIRLERFWHLVSGDGAAPTTSRVLAERSGDLRRAILMVLHCGKSQSVEGVRDSVQLLRHLDNQGIDTSEVRKLMRDLVHLGLTATTEEGRKAVIARMFGRLSPLLPGGMTLPAFSTLECFNWRPEFAHADERRATCRVEYDGRSVDVQIGTVHSMKGETHLASLVLESYSGQVKKFDLEDVLPVVAEVAQREAKLSEQRLGQYRTLYVGMSRPSSLLCVAVNAERVTDECKAALIARGWQFEHLS